MRRDRNNDSYDNINDEGFGLIHNGVTNDEDLESNKNFDFTEFKEFIDINNYLMRDEFGSGDPYLSVIKRNSFQLLKDTYESIGYIPDEIKSDIISLLKVNSSNIPDNINENKHSALDLVNDYLCSICNKNFPSVATYEMHVKYCVKEDYPNNWDNFGNNYINRGNSNNQSYSSQENIANVENYPDNNFSNDHNIHQIHMDISNEINVNNYDYEQYSLHNDSNDTYRSRSSSVSNHGNNHIENIDFNQSNLNYEELLRLDENIKHPLNKYYLSMLITEKLNPASISHLAGDSKKCLICFDDFELNQNIIRLPCFHIFHESELTHWFETNKTCPICRVNIEELLSDY